MPQLCVTIIGRERDRVRVLTSKPRNLFPAIAGPKQEPSHPISPTSGDTGDMGCVLWDNPPGYSLVLPHGDRTSTANCVDGGQLARRAFKEL